MTQTKAQLVDLSVQGINASDLSSGTIPDARFPATLPASSGANLTSLPAANLIGTLPAISGANLTNLPSADLSNLNATNLLSGTIPDARFPATLPAISGANLTNLPASGISNVVEDTSPELGGNLDVLTSEIVTSTSNGNIKLAPNGSGAVEIKGDGSSYEGCLQLNCHVNSHGVKIKSPPHSAGQSYTMILPDNQIEANKFLQVKSITGSGNTAVGQLEYSDTFKGSVTFEGAINENVVGLFNPWALDADDGTIQTFSITGNRTVTMSLTTGQSVLLLCDHIYGGSYTVTWPAGIKWVGGSAPTLSTTAGNPTAIEFFQVGSQLYGAAVGDLS